MEVVVVVVEVIVVIAFSEVVDMLVGAVGMAGRAFKASCEKYGASLCQFGRACS